MRDRVTISLYSKEIDGPLGYNRDFLSEISNIGKICGGLVKAAKEAEREPPEFILSILLVPNWDRKNNSYVVSQYLQQKKSFLDEVTSHLKQRNIDDIVVEDFYLNGKMSDEEKAYMHGLKAKGSNADMIKIRAIINVAKHCRHLQIDSNTVVPSFKELYEKTFNAAVQKDGINASYYDPLYISAHNKMVYTTPTGFIAQASQLEMLLKQWCKDHQNDDNINGDKHEDKNSIYARVFTVALHNIKYVEEFNYSLDQEDKTVYPATLDDKVYWLTTYMVTAVNSSWRPKKEDQNEYVADIAMIEKAEKELKELPSVPIGEDGLFNYQCFSNVIKKHTGNLRMHSRALRLSDPSAMGESSRDLLLNVSDSELELEATKKFMVNAIQKVPHLTDNLLSLFQNTNAGRKLTEKLFGCSILDLPKVVGEIVASSSQNSATQLEQEDQKASTSLRR
jgi:hypothetical protein